MRVLRPFFCWSTALGLLLSFCAVSGAQQPASQQNAVDHLQPVRWLAGKTWVADPVDPTSKKTVHIENTIRASDNGSNIEFAARFDGKPQYNGFYAWDPATKQIRFWYTSSEGELSQGVAEPDGEGVLQTFSITSVEGKVTSLRSHIKPLSADAYDWNVETQQNGKWVELVHLRYTRKA